MDDTPAIEVLRLNLASKQDSRRVKSGDLAQFEYQAERASDVVKRLTSEIADIEKAIEALQYPNNS